jgi:hypothetical protein
MSLTNPLYVRLRKRGKEIISILLDNPKNGQITKRVREGERKINKNYCKNGSKYFVHPMLFSR